MSNNLGEKVLRNVYVIIQISIIHFCLVLFAFVLSMPCQYVLSIELVTPNH